MWETIEQVLISGNAWVVLILFIFLGFILLLLSRNGLLQIDTGNIQIGAATGEREIIRQQVEWTRLHYEGLENSMAKPEGYDHWRGRYIAERLIDEVVDWIVYNHINNSRQYIEIKQDKIINILRKYTVKEEFTSEEFENSMRKDTENCIKKLIQIRELH